MNIFNYLTFWLFCFPSLAAKPPYDDDHQPFMDYENAHSNDYYFPSIDIEDFTPREMDSLLRYDKLKQCPDINPNPGPGPGRPFVKALDYLKIRLTQFNFK